MVSSKIEFSFNRISRIQDVSDLAEILFPSNRNQQHAFLVIWISLKWAAHSIVPNLAEVANEHGVSRRTFERVRAKMRRMGLIEHVSRFDARGGFRDGWVLSMRCERSLRRLADAIGQFRETGTGMGSREKDELLLGLAEARRAAAGDAHSDDHEVTNQG